MNTSSTKAQLKKFLLRLNLIFLMLISVSLSAQVTLPHYDEINYTAGQGLQTQTGWTTLNSGDDLLIATGNLSYTGLPASSGNKVTFAGTGIDAAKLFTQQTSGTVYYSFLMNVTALGTLNTTGGYFTSLNEGTGTNFGATVWTRSDGIGYDIGINPRTTAANTAWSTGTTAINTTVFVVISYQIVSGTTNDIVKLWINPTPGTAEPTPTLTATNTLADLLNLNRILIRQDAATTTPSIEMDELRIGTTWAAVTPSGSCSTADNITALSATVASGQSVVSWTNGSCFDEMLVVVSNAAFTGTEPSGDGTAYTASSASFVDGLNTALLGGRVVYKGNGSSVTVTGLTNGTSYNIRVYTRKGTVWNTPAPGSISTTVTPAVNEFVWDADGNTTGATGGTGTWDIATLSNWRTPNSTGTLGLWSGNTVPVDAVFGGAVGTVSAVGGLTFTAPNFNFITSGYTLASTSGTSLVLAGNIALGNNVNLTLAPNTSVAASDGIIDVRNISGSGTASIIIEHNSSGTTTNERINFNAAAAGSNISVPITISGTGLGYAGFGSQTTTATVSGNISNFSSAKTALGASSPNSLFVTGIISGSSDVIITQGSAGGAGTVVLSGANTYTGNTLFNNSASGILRISGGNNRLPVTTNLVFGQTSSNGASIFDLNGLNQTIAGLTNNVTAGGIIRNSAASTTSLLTINGSTSLAAYSGIIENGTGTVALTRAGSGATTLSGANTYTGATTVTSGTLYLNGTNASNITVGISGEIGGNGSTTGTLNLTGNVSPGATGVGSVGTFTTGAQTWNNGAFYNFDIPTAAVSALNQDRIVSTGAVALSGTITIDVSGTAGGFSDGTAYTWPLITGTSVTGSPTYTLITLGFVPAFTGTFSISQTPTALNLVYTPLAATPSLTTDVASLTGLNYGLGQGPSASQTVNLTGADLTGFTADITITQSTDFEVSSNNITFGATALISFTSATLTSTPFYVRLKAGRSVASYGPQTITISGGGGSASITASGTVTPAFTPGNIVVFQAAASANNTTGAVLEILPSSVNATPVNTFTIDGLTAPNHMRFSGSATSTGYLSTSNDGSLLMLTGHNSNNTGVNANTLTARGVVTYNSSGIFALPTTYTSTSGQQARGATSINNSTFYIADQNGIYSNGTSAPSPAANYRSIRAFGGVVYAFISSAAVPPVGVISAPTGGTFTALPGLANGNTSRQDFYMVSSGSNGSTFDVLYILDATSATVGTIFKYSLVAGSWIANGTQATTFGGFGLTAERNPAGGATLWISTGTGATTANDVRRLVDAAGFNATINITTNTVIYTAPVGTILKGVAFAPGKPRVNLYASATSGFEALSTSITVSAIASAPVVGNQTVNVTVTGTGITGGDYTVPASITILNGQTTGTATFQITNDAIGPEGTETAIITINTPSSGIVIGATNSVNIAITDDESNPSVSISVSSTTGSETAATVVTVTATATSNVTGGNQTVDVAVTGPGITAGDYTLSAATITIPDGTNTGSVTFTIVDDAAGEGTETATLTISNPSFGVEIGSPFSANITITDNEPSIAVGSQGITIVNTLDKPSQRNIIYQSSFVVTIANATLTGLTVPTAGTYQTTDLTAATFRLWYNVTSTNFYESIQLGSAVAPVASGGNVVFNGFSQLINNGQTATIWVTVDIAAGAVTNRTISTAANPFTNFTFTTTGGLTGTNPVAASAVQTVVGNSPTFTGVIVPQFIQGIAGINNNRIPYVYRATVAGLTPGATYRYFNQICVASDAGNANGAGNAIYPAAGLYTRSTGVNLSVPGNYGEFTTDGTGSYTGWFITEPSANARFIPGNVVNFRLCLNDGVSGTPGTSVVNRITTALSATILNFGNTSGAGTQCTGLTGSTYGTEKNLVMLYDNINGTGRPISSAIIENDGAGVASYAPYYPNGIANSFGSIIPNNLSNGIRRVEERDLASGAIVDCPRVDADGIWPNAGSTSSPSGGITAIALNATDFAPIAIPTFTTFNYINAVSVSISWVAVPGATSYIVDIATTSNFTSGFLVPNNTNIGNVTTYNVNGLSAGNIYYYRVRATNDVCTSGYSDVTPFLTSAIVWEGTVGTDWNVPQNWSPFLVPTVATDIEIFDRTNDPIIPSAGLNGSARNVAFNGVGANLQIQLGKTLNVSGTWESVGNTISGAGQVVFNGTGAQTLTGATTFQNLTIDKTSGTLSITSGMQSVRGIVRPNNGTLTTNGNLRLVSNAAATGIISGNGAGSISGNVEVNRYMPGPVGYRYVSSPITQAAGLTTADFDVSLVGANGLLWDPLFSIPSPFPNCWYYDESQLNTYAQYGWTSATPGALVTGRGYALITPANHTASLVGPVNNASVTATNPITKTGVQNGAGVNLIGNPYPSPISWNAFRALNGASEIAAVVKRFASTGSYYGQYVDWNGTVGTPGSVGDNIALGQAFFVTKINAGSTIINYNNSLRIDNTSTTFYETQAEVNNLLRLQLVGGAGADELVVYFDPTATNNYDVNYDAIKFLSETAGIPNIYTNIDTLKVSINVLESFNQDMVIPMGIAAKTAGNYQVNVVDMSTFAPSSTVYLEDRDLGTFTNLRTVNQYNVNLPVGEHNGRFFIHFRPAVEVAVTNETCQQTDGTVAVVNPSTEQQWNVSLLDIAGQVVAQSTEANTAFTNLNDGTYTLRITDASGYTVDQPVIIEAGQVVEANIAPMNSNYFYTTDLIEASVAQVITGMTYEWYLNGLLAGTGTEITLNVTEPGVYELMLKMSGATCIFQTSTSFSVTQESTVGIETAESASGFIIYPNPTRDILNVQINQKIGFTKLSIFDASGRLVHTEMLNGAQAQQTIQVNLNELAAGLYQITLEGNQKRSTAKFSKTK